MMRVDRGSSVARVTMVYVAACVDLFLRKAKERKVVRREGAWGSSRHQSISCCLLYPLGLCMQVKSISRCGLSESALHIALQALKLLHVVQFHYFVVPEAGAEPKRACIRDFSAGQQ